MATSIPEKARRLVKERERQRCCRCGVPAPNGHWHHRRSRSVRDQHQHCACNGVWLCSACHTWVHGNPFLARGTGFIVSRHQDAPGSVIVTTAWGLREHNCHGTYHIDEI